VDRRRVGRLASGHADTRGAASTTPKEADEFERMRLTAKIERARGFVAQYDEHQDFYHREIEDGLYELGKLDERLGD
jgi:hypothetical protein